MKDRCRASEAGSVEAGRFAAHRFFFANRFVWAVVGAFEPARVPGATRWSQSEPDRASKNAQEQPKSAKSDPKCPNSAQERPKSTPERPKSAQETLKSVPRSPKRIPRAPNRGSPGALERAERPNRSNQGDLDETLPLRSKINENTAHAQQN